MPYYKFSHKLELTAAEREVQKKDFPFVSTTILKPGEWLNEHSHHSDNTHYIVKGSLDMGQTTTVNACASCLQPDNKHNKCSQHKHPDWYVHEKAESKPAYRFRNFVLKVMGTYHPVPANTTYMSEMAGPDGCKFVERHKRLSLVSAQRFAARQRATVIEAKQSDPGAFWVENHHHQAQSPVEHSAVDGDARKRPGLEDSMSQMAIGTSTTTSTKQKREGRADDLFKR